MEVKNESIVNFEAMVEDSRNSPDNCLFEEMDGSRHSWAELSSAAKLHYIARDAAIAGVQFEPFAQAVKETIGGVEEAALRVVFDGQKELHAIATLLPDDGRTEPTPLVDQIKDMLDYISVLETPAEPRNLSLRDLRHASQKQEERGQDQVRESREVER